VVIMTVLSVLPAQRPLLEVSDLTVQYPGLRGLRGRPAVDDVGFTVRPGESVGLVGISGSGKSTVVRALLGQLRPRDGRITFAGRDLLGCPEWTARRRRGGMRLVLGEDYAALPPDRRVGAIVADGLDPLSRLDPGRVGRTLELVGLAAADRYRYPHQLSRADRERVAFARALVGRPRLLVADEPAGMTDDADRGACAQVLLSLRRAHGLAVLHLTHDLRAARLGCDRLVVLRGGRVVEQGPTERVLSRPEHPYTAELVSASLAGAA
jgi:peptide/nickel transport system ATP-binding protein